MAGIQSNLVAFVPVQGTRVFLTLTSDWVFSSGLKPNVNSAIVPYTEFDKLPPDPGSDTGDVEFWFSATPGSAPGDDGGLPQPDVTLQQWRIVEIKGTKKGIPQGTDGDGNAYTLRWIEYEIFFADFREQFLEPRGGRLRVGLLNAGPKPLPSSQQGQADQTDPAESGSLPPQVPEMSLADMISLCLSKMGQSAANVPTLTQDAPRDIKWFGNHAPTELAKLLAFAGCAFNPQPDGTATIDPIVSQGEPQIPDALSLLPEITMPGVDRRGKTVIFSSYPFPTVFTRTLEGPRDDQWQFVLQDSKDQWQTPTNCDLVSVFGLLQEWQNGFADVQENFRARAMGQAYRFIRLGDGSNPPQGIDANTTVPFPPSKQCPVHTRSMAPDGTLQDLQITARIAVQDPSSGLYSNTSGLVRVQGIFKSDLNVIQLASPLIKVANPTYNLRVGAQELNRGELQVQFSYPVSTQDASGNWTPSFFHVGFQRANGQITQLADADADAAVDGGGGAEQDVVVFPCGEAMQLRMYEEGTYGKDQLVATAQAWAAGVLANAGDPARTVQAIGFITCPLDGYVNEVRWSQREVLTTVICNSWYRPAGSIEATVMRKLEAGGAVESYPLQGATQETRTAIGEAGATQPMVPLNPTGGGVAGASDAVVMVGAFIGAGEYNGTIQTGNINDDESAVNLTMADEGLTAGPSCLLLVTEEDSAVVDNVGNKPTGVQRLMQGSYVVGLVKGMSNENTPRPIVLVRGGAGSMAGLAVINPSPTQTTADNTLWTRSGTAELGAGTPTSGPFAIYLTTRAPVWLGGTANQWLGFQRKFYYDARGLLFRIDPEEKIVYTGTIGCSLGG